MGAGVEANQLDFYGQQSCAVKTTGQNIVATVQCLSPKQIQILICDLD